jgi:hypothetical protein
MAGLKPALRTSAVKMTGIVPEAHKKPGVSYAFTDDGLELPVIDVTHPAFAIAPTEAELAALTDAFLGMIERMRAISSEAEREATRKMMATSIIGRGLQAGSGTFLTGVNTYLMKLGPDNLGAYAAPLDRQIAAALPLVSLRMRVQDVARLQAEALAPALAASPGQPLHFINIAGGPTIDSLNVLILLRRDRPDLLERRRIAIHVFDQDQAGPAFGRRALEALLAPGAKLDGLDVSFTLVPYDWRHLNPLTEELATLELDAAVWAASSEGGLFEYGDDEAIVANLRALREAGAGGSVTGSVTRDEGPGALSRDPNGVATIPRSLASFTALAERGGWRVDEVITGPYSFNLRLV